LEYLLLEYYHDDDDDDNKFNKKSLGRVLEVGAGCGLLGQCLAATAAIKNQQQQQQRKNQQQNTMSLSFKAVVMTDVEPVLNNLRQNVQSNLPILKQQTSNCTGPSHVLDSKQIAVIGHDKLDSIQVCELDWTDIDRCVQSSNGLLQQHTYDVVVGTDILFAPHLAIPLLRTIQWATHKGSVVYICVHQRCSKTHEIFQSQSNKYDLIVEDISDEVYSKYPSIQWGKQLECILFRIKKTM
jgi:predicted nicotinamide N-methyase